MTCCKAKVIPSPSLWSDKYLRSRWRRRQYIWKWNSCYLSYSSYPPYLSNVSYLYNVSYFFSPMFVASFNYMYVSEFCRTQLMTQKFLFFRAKHWIPSDMKVWINTALLTFLITEHIYSYKNVFSVIFYILVTYLQCVSPITKFLENYNCFII
jgi:hypothetical protein